MGLIRRESRDMTEDVISRIGSNGRHILSSGKVATALSDERLTSGDSVLIITDDKGKHYIVSGKR